jgi:pimeloyl-ACP methyl ester carboxylesterase
VFGTLLDAQGQRIWIDLPQLAIGGLARLETNDPCIEPAGLVDLYYADLIEHLSATHTVIPFPYDWRHSVWEEANRFADALDERLLETDRPVRIVAHSMGGLVARAALAQSPSLWERFKERDGWASIHVMPLWKETAPALKAWIAIRPRTDAPEFFLNSAGCAMTRSGFGHILAKHVRRAGEMQRSLIDKRVTCHVLRHTCAMHTGHVRQGGVRSRVELGHL